MKAQVKNQIIFMLFALLVGSISGIIIWSFFRIMNMMIYFIWELGPSYISIPFYTIIVCSIGGIIIGFCRKTFGDYPEELPVVMKKVKEDGGYPYNNIGKMLISAILPLIFGASIGPEAGLTGVIAALCTWVGDKLKNKFKELKELTQIGISATLGTIFRAPLFGFIEPLEEEEENTELPKTSKIIVYFLAIIGAFGIFIILGNFFGGGEGLPSFDNVKIELKEWIYLLPLGLIGVLFGFIYHIFNNISKKVFKKLDKYEILKGLFGGLTLGIIGTILPFTMFSGESQMYEVMNNWAYIGAGILLATGFLKLLITNVCIEAGLKGGNFFPIIFSGVSIGYGLAIILGINPVFTAMVITASIVSSVLRKPLATVLLLLICFPIEGILPILIAAVIGSSIKIPKGILEKS